MIRNAVCFEILRNPFSPVCSAEDWVFELRLKYYAISAFLIMMQYFSQRKYSVAFPVFKSVQPLLQNNTSRPTDIFTVSFE